MSAPTGLSEYSIALKAGTLLVDQYTIVGVLGRPGGFGITYLAEDIRLDTLVAIKEFLPRELATRAPDRSTIITHSGDHDSSFHRGLEQFLREARTLAKIHHPSVVRVRQFFEANGTAYLVMDYLEGQTLSELVREAGGRLPAPRAVEIIMDASSLRGGARPQKRGGRSRTWAAQLTNHGEWRQADETRAGPVSRARSGNAFRAG